MIRQIREHILPLSFGLVGFALLILAMVGCGSEQGPGDALMPEQETEAKTPSFVETPLVASGLGNGIGQELRAGSTTKLIKAEKGGTVLYGRFKVEIPADALDEDTYITVRKPGGPYLICELEPHGIQFNKPVQLTMDVEDLSTAPYTDWTIFWLDDTISLWIDLGAVFDDDEHELRVDLEHFSAYGGGRAGW